LLLMLLKPAVPVQLLLPLSPNLGSDPLEDAPLLPVPPVALEALHRHLADALKQPIDLIPTTNRRTMLTWRQLPDGWLQIRIHSQFALADKEIHADLARYISTRDREAANRLKVWGALWQRPPKPRFAHPAGRHHDLRDHFASNRARFFDGAFDGRIGWSRSRRGRVRRRIRLGSWSPEHRLIRVHPVLDARDVPDYVVDFVVYHEMLHGSVPAEQRGGRRRVHTKAFRAREHAHPHHERAESWLHGNLDALLSW
jgi:hypothetical protein